MAGTLLLIAKPNVKIEAFKQTKALLKAKIDENFAGLFPRLIFHELRDECFLVEFRKDEEQKFFKQNDGSWLCYEGTVFALNETKSYNAEELLELYFKNGKDFAHLLDGHFVIKMYDIKADKYLVINDFIKNKTNFLCETGDYIMFTPFAITSGVIKKPELDLEAFNEFLWRYYILSEKSILKGVKRLKAASQYTITSEQLKRETYWEWPKNYSKLKFTETVNKAVANMKETARLITKKFGKPCIDFTMGQDTRQVIAAFASQNIDFTTSIFGKSDFYEVKKVSEIAKNFGIENHNIQLNEDYTENLWEHFKNSLILGSCEEPGYLLGRLIYMRKQQSAFSKVSLNGMDGHFYKNGLWDEMYTFNFYREPKSFNIASFLKLRALSKKYNDSFFTEAFRDVKNNSEKYFSSQIKEAVKTYEDSPVSIQVDRFDLYHWLNFAMVSNNSGNLIHHSISPLLLRRNLELALQVPVKWKFNLSKFQRALVYQLHPKLAKVKTDFAGVNMLPKNILTLIPFYFRYFYFQSERLRKKILSKFGFNIATHLQEAWDYLPLYKKLLSDVHFAENLKYDSLMLKSIIKEPEWNDFIKKYKTPDKLTLNDFEYLFKLVSVEAFLKKVSA